MATRAVMVKVVLFMVRIRRTGKITTVAVKTLRGRIRVARRVTRNAVCRCVRTGQDKPRCRVIE